MNGRSNTLKWMVIGCLLLLPLISIFAQGSLNKGGDNPKEIMELETVIDQSFEAGVFPGSPWQLLTPEGNYGWGPGTARASDGEYSLWCAKKRYNNAEKRRPAVDGYANGMDTWAILGTEADPIDLRNCVSGELSFYLWHKIAVGDHFYVYANPGSGWKGVEYVGQNPGWEKKTLDLAAWPGHGNLLGQASVRFAFYFKSNASVVAEGVFIDKVVLTRDFTGWPDLVISNLSFSPASQEVGEKITISGTIANTETNAATVNELKVYLSKDQNIDPNEDIYMNAVQVPRLEGGESTNFSKQFFVPVSLPLENFYVGGFVDPGNDVPEENENNNTYAVSSAFSPQSAAGYEDILRDCFETDNYPGPWERYKEAGDYSWDEVMNNVTGYDGDYSIWCARKNYGAGPSLVPSNGYANDMSAWSRVGPFDLTDAEAADISFYMWTQQVTGDKTQVEANFGTGWESYEYKGDTNQWVYQQLDLSNWPVHGSLLGNNAVSIAFHFSSNAAGTATGTYIDNVVIRKKLPGTAVQRKNMPEKFILDQNSPNPFNPSTTISYTLPKAADVRLTVYNIFGQEVVTLVDENVNAGHQTVTWDGTDHRGLQVSSGVYFYRLKAGSFTAMKKMILVE